MPELRLGKRPAKLDSRTIKLSSILKKKLLPDLPETYDIDEAVGGVVDDNMYANDQYGCCVIAARAHQSLRYEKFEQGIQPPITDQEVIDEYLKETGGEDSGLYLLDSLKAWRKGWLAGGKTYSIYAFASVEWKDHDEVKHCIHLLGGVNFGMEVYSKDMEQFKAGKIWEITSSSGFYQGGHGVYTPAFIKIVGYNEVGPVCVTWGKCQQMTWEFWDARVDEAYGIVDNRDDWIKDSPVDVAKLDGYLKEITAGNEEPSSCSIAKGFIKCCNFILALTRRDTRLKAFRER